MSPDPRASGSVRSAADINDQIRALWLRAGGRLDAVQRGEYERLLVEWAAAVPAAVTRAA